MILYLLAQDKTEMLRGIHHNFHKQLTQLFIHVIYMSCINNIEVKVQ